MCTQRARIPYVWYIYPVQRDIFEPEHNAFRESVRGFLAKEAVPHGADWEARGMVDRDFWRKAATQGLVGFAAPERLGGMGIDDFRFNAVIDEEVAYADVGTDNFGLENDIVAPYLLELANDEQQRRWLPGFTSGDLIVAIAMSEPGAGSDLRGMKSIAKLVNGGYVLNGSKTFVTSGIQADLVIVAARDGDGLTLLGVSDGATGFTRGRKLEKVGRRAQDTAELFFEDVQVPDTDVIGEPGRGLHHLMANLPQERLSIAVNAVACAEAALQLTVTYCRERMAFGGPLTNLQSVRMSLAELSSEILAGRSLVDRCIFAHLSRELEPNEAAAAKAWTTDLQFRVLDRCMQLHGGYGYMEDYRIARMWRDGRVQRIYGGANEVMMEIVGRALVG